MGAPDFAELQAGSRCVDVPLRGRIALSAVLSDDLVLWAAAVLCSRSYSKVPSFGCVCFGEHRFC